ncbi:DNA-binding protein Ets98B isoform X2 [Rhodnius prolixus]|uniref:DNA-binding protein Ets98B isoform X2 n=1 Tax=Rhodnius prolixus TaxID=13249 RepID=UPI003D18E523
MEYSYDYYRMPQRVPSGGFSPPSGADYTAVFAAESFDLSLLPPSPSVHGLYDPVKEEPTSGSLFSWDSAYSPSDPYSPQEIKQETTIDLDEPLVVINDRKDGIIRSLLEAGNNNNLYDNPLSNSGKSEDHKLLREVLKDTSFQKKYNLIPVSVGELGTGFRTEMEEVSMDLSQEEIEPMLSLAMEQLKTEVHSTCAVLGISRDPSKWTAEEVETWLAWNLAQYSLPSTTAQYFQMPGHSLVTLSEQDFQQRAPEGGSLLHAQLELWKAASMDETTVDVSGLLHETTTTRSGSSSGEPSDDEEDDEMGSTSQASPKSSSSRGGSSSGGSHIHLWQFLKELLNSPAMYGTCIRWVDRQTGVFKIEDSVRVARLWGQRKNRPAMNYDKLSRSIRQYYKKGIMKKTERSQRLVYQFCHPYSL